MSRKKIVAIIAATVIVVIAIVATVIVWRRNSAPDVTAAPSATTMPMPTTSTRPSYPPTYTPTATPTPTATVSPTATKPPVTQKPKPIQADGNRIIIGAISMVLPKDYERTDGSDLQSVSKAEFIGPDNAVYNNRYYESVLKLSSIGIMDMSDEQGELLEGICPFGDGDAEYVPHRPDFVKFAGTTMTVTRATYVCGRSVFTVAS